MEACGLITTRSEKAGVVVETVRFGMRLAKTDNTLVS